MMRIFSIAFFSSVCYFANERKKRPLKPIIETQPLLSTAQTHTEHLRRPDGPSRAGRLALQVVAEFLEYWELHQTISILRLEADMVSLRVLRRLFPI